MSDNTDESSERLSEQELAKAEELQAEVKRKLSIVLNDSRTPESFKKAFRDFRDSGEE